MKICLASDLHLEFENQKPLPPLPECDLLVLAGDIHYAPLAIKWIKETYPDQLTVYVPGNHCFYHADYEETLYWLLNTDFGNLKVLPPGVFDFGEYCIIGAPLWSSLSLPGYQDFPDYVYEEAISDFKLIKGWSAFQHKRENEGNIDFIYRELEWTRDNNRKAIVVTHFVPTMQCIAPFFKTSNINPYFINDLDELIDEFKPEAWLFGHTHSSFDQLHSNWKTRLVCNPRGYPKEKSKAFKWKEIEL